MKKNSIQKRKIITFLLFTCVVTALFCEFAGAHNGRAILRIPELSTEDLDRIDIHDGVIEDWIEVIGDPVLTPLDFYTYPGHSFDPSDFDFRIWLGWNQEHSRIYGALSLIDDDYTNHFSRPTRNYSGGIHSMEVWDGSIAIYVDGDHSGGDLPPEEGFFQAQLYTILGVTHDNGPKLEPMWSVGLSSHTVEDIQDWYLRPPYAEGGGERYGENPTVAITEFFLTPFDRLELKDPDNSRPSNLETDRGIGILIEVGDAFGIVERTSQPFVWPNPVEHPFNYFLCETWGDAILLPKKPVESVANDSGGSQTDLLVSNVSWGRIKASLSE